MLSTILIFIIVLLVLVLSHEFGHFIVAKRSGVKVEEFGFGFPPRLFGIQKGETLYSFNLLPLGGFVRLEGEDTDVSGPRSFLSQSFGKQAFIITAGVIANIIVGFLLFSVVHWIGTPTILDPDDPNLAVASDIRVHIIDVLEHTPAELAGVRPGDIITGLRAGDESRDYPTLSQTQDFISVHQGSEILLRVGRSGEFVELPIIPRTEFPEDEGAVGVVISQTGLIRAPWYRAIALGFQTTLQNIRLILQVLWMLIGSLFGGPPIYREVAGPIGIVAIVGETGHLGVPYLLQLIGMLSVNLAVINILPIPALDGGRLLFIVLEKLRGAPFAPHVPRLIHSVGFLVLIGLLIFISYWDIVRFF